LISDQMSGSRSRSLCASRAAAAQKLGIMTVLLHPIADCSGQSGPLDGTPKWVLVFAHFAQSSGQQNIDCQIPDDCGLLSIAAEPGIICKCPRG
jgi:hypothetical protein